MPGKKKTVRAHLMSLADSWADIYEKLEIDFKDDGVGLTDIPMDLLIAGDQLANPPTGLGYNSGALNAFLNAYINTATGRTRYSLQPNAKITGAMISAASDTPTVATLVNLISDHQ